MNPRCFARVVAAALLLCLFVPGISALDTSVIQLSPGWNFVSTPVALRAGNDTAAVVFAGVDTDGHSVFVYNASVKVWQPMTAASTVKVTDGIWIYSKTAVAVPLSPDPDPVPVPEVKNLSAGWNAIGFPQVGPSTARDSLASVNPAWENVTGFDAVSQQYEVPFINGDTGPHSDLNEVKPFKGYWLSMQSAGSLSAVSANFSSDVKTGYLPLTVRFTDQSAGSPASWNWSFGDGSFSEQPNPVHTYTAPGNYTVSLIASNGFASDNRTVADYIGVRPAITAYDAEVVLSSLPATMFQGEHYIVDIKVNNTGSVTWYADPASANLVYLQAAGGASGDAAKFNITRIPMIFKNETVAPGGRYDFFFYVQAPDTIGTYAPQYQLVSAGGGAFGPVINATVNVIGNPFHPVLQPDGSKLYTTTFGNTSAGIKVEIVGPRVYLDDFHVSRFDDPRFLINPTLKSTIFDLELNGSFSYADITIQYDPAKVATPANLALGYFNQTTGNYTFVPSTVNTADHTVTSRVTHFSTYGTLDRVAYHALPVPAQNEMGYINIDPGESSTIYPVVDSWDYTYFFNGAGIPPGNYTISTSGSYTSYYVQYIGCVGWKTADSNPDETYGYYVNFNNPSGGYKQVQKLRVASGVLRVDHKGGPISVYHSHIVNGVCGAVGYQAYYSDGPAFRDNESYYSTGLNNDAFNLTATGYDLAVIAYQAAAGCVLGQAGQKGGALDAAHSLIPGWNSAITDDVTESTAYMVGHVACAIAFPEIALARDFTADVLRGDGIGAALDSLGYLGTVRNIMRTTGIIPAFIEKSPQEVNAGQRIMNDLWRMGIYHTELPTAEKVGLLDKAFAGAATRLSGQGVADDVIAGIYEHNGDIAKTLKAGARTDNGKVRWLEEGWTLQEAQDAGRNSATGWKHIVEDHVRDGAYNDISKNDFAAAFDPTGMNYRNAGSIQELILDCVKNGEVNPSKPIENYKKVTDTKAIRVIIGDNGYIRTAYPVKISDVPIPLP